MRPADIAAGRLEAELAEQIPQDGSRSVSIAFEDFLQPGQPFLDPLDGRGLKHFFTTAAEAFKFFFQRLDLPLCVQKCLGEGSAAAPLADEIDEVRESTFLGVELSFLESQRFGDVGVECSDLLLDAAEDIVDRFRGGEVLPQGVQDDLLDQPPPDEQFVLAGSLRGRDAAIVAAGFPADFGHVGAACPADHGA